METTLPRGGQGLTSIHITGDKLIIFTSDDHKITVQLTPLTDTETGAIVWRDHDVIGGLWRREFSDA